MSEEINIHQDSQVLITSVRVVIEGKTYPVANITSVGMVQQNPSGLFPITLILGGLFALFISIPTLFNAKTWDNNYTALTVGILMLVIGVAMMRTSKPTYIIQLSTAAGEIKALQSLDRAYIAKLTEAINQAIIKRG